MNIINNIKEAQEEKRQEIARPYVSDALKVDRENLLGFFTRTRAGERESILLSLENIKYDKPFPKGTSNNDAFNLAVQEAISIVRSVLRD